MQLQPTAVLPYSITQGTILQWWYKLYIFSNDQLPLNSHQSSFRASPSEFVIPLAKYVKAVYHTRVSVGMRFRMLFETEESSVRR